ncbi:LysR family transcriptional regulator [Chitinasiproducens palmae]|uniref:DNA-binding transcriptional regulator, LysR family n=1 Tax=Chitinasiproducens palmae TaxID=1770053 RepID=A0A1H2PL49_9BURK|nr:LysR family transcriptional regulator [Chitinasiproducens palmae]SDV46704.1 DNA-binding transcriptional regulator, LysR family [Chitinasiproducens palmae]
MPRPTLHDLHAFAAVATQRSFRRAADLIGVSRSSLSHAMRGLEADLGLRLLNRTTRSVSLTPEGQRLLARLAPLLADLDAALGDASAAAGQPSGTLRVNGNEAAIRMLLQTVIPVYLSRYPAVEVDLVAQGQFVDIVADGFDAGVRLAEAVPKDMIAVPLGGDVRFLAVASPAYLARHPPPATPDGLLSHRCIRQRLPSGKRYRWEFERQGETRAIDVNGALTLDNSQLMVEAAADGLGIAYVPEPYARRLLDAGALLTVCEAWCSPTDGLRLYYPANRHVPPALRALIDLVRSAR